MTEGRTMTEGSKNLRQQIRKIAEDRVNKPFSEMRSTSLFQRC